MIKGMLLINIDPPYVSFSQSSVDSAGNGPGYKALQHCSLEEIKTLLVRLDALLPDQSWPPQECILRLPIVCTKSELSRFSLLNLKPHSHKAKRIVH